MTPPRALNPQNRAGSGPRGIQNNSGTPQGRKVGPPGGPIVDSSKNGPHSPYGEEEDHDPLSYSLKHHGSWQVLGFIGFFLIGLFAQSISVDRELL